MASLDQLERFVLSVRLDSFKAAAEQLYVSPQTVSKSVHDLEREWKTFLFEPTPRSLNLTSVGSAVYRYAADILENFDEIDRIVAEGDSPKVSAGSIRVAACSSPFRGSVFKAQDFEPFKRQYPRVSLEVSYHPAPSCLDMLQSGLVDAAIVVGKPDSVDFCCSKIRSCLVHLMVARKHPLAHFERVSLLDLNYTAVALPYDIGYCYRMLVEKAAASGASLRFESLEMEKDSHDDFIQDRDGGIFVFPDEELARSYPRAKIVQFNATDQVVAPFYFVWRAGVESSLLALLLRYLQLRS